MRCVCAWYVSVCAVCAVHQCARGGDRNNTATKTHISKLQNKSTTLRNNLQPDHANLLQTCLPL